MNMNSKIYSVTPDNLLRGAAHPIDMRTMMIKNPGCELKRGCLVKLDSDGGCFIAGDKKDDQMMNGDVIGILGHNVILDETSDMISAAVYVSGGFSIHGVMGINDYERTEGDIISAQKYGLYIS